MRAEPDQRLTVVHVTAPGAVGGAESVVTALARGHAALNHNVHVVSVFDTGAQGRALCDGVPGVRTHAVVIPSRRYWLERSAVAAIARETNADIVHTHGYRSDVVDGAGMVKRGLRVVSTVHGFTGGGFKNQLFEFLQLRTFRRFDAVVAVSAPLVPRLVAAGVPPGVVHHIRNAWSPRWQVLDRATARARLGLPAVGAVVGWIGRLSKEKGPDVFLQALRLIPEGAPKAVIIGDGRERAALEATARSWGMGDRVAWCGQVEDAAALVKAFDVFVLSSRTEGTPIVLFEAIAAGVPIVTTRVGGIPDVVSSAEAVLVPPENAPAIADAVRHVLATPAESAARAVAAQRRLDRDFAAGPWLTEYEDLYRSVIRHDERPGRG